MAAKLPLLSSKMWSTNQVVWGVDERWWYPAVLLDPMDGWVGLKRLKPGEQSVFWLGDGRTSAVSGNVQWWPLWAPFNCVVAFVGPTESSISRRIFGHLCRSLFIFTFRWASSSGRLRWFLIMLLRLYFSPHFVGFYSESSLPQWKGPYPACSAYRVETAE